MGIVIDGGRWLARVTLLVLTGVMLNLGGGAALRANPLPGDAPILISEANSTRARFTIANESLTSKPGAQIVQPGRDAVITLYLTNLDLLPGEGANAFRADLEDARHHRYRLPITGFEPVAHGSGVYALSVRLGPGLGRLGEVLVRVAWRGMSSNRVRLAIGYAGGKIEDDPGAAPTPWPETRSKRSDPSPARVALPGTGDNVRFMEQAAFGPDAALEIRLRRLGLSTWFEEQTDPASFAAFDYPDYPLQPTTPLRACDGDPSVPDVPITCFRDNYTMYPLQNWFFREALYDEDQQLRRRVSWALSQIFVVSGRRLNQPSSVLPYVKVLDRNAFGNFRTLLEQITLSPAMGTYLDLATSTQANPNENYAREIMQLFTIGVDRLNPDGTPMLDGSGHHLPSYNQDTIDNFTKVFTGWTYCFATCINSAPGLVDYRDPLVSDIANHDTSAKTLLSYNGANPNVPAGQTPEQDLASALDNIFNHPNVPPFISRSLIQQLVTSNPTPAFVGRVAAVFADNGHGVRGDLKAVIRAILMDPEARGDLKTDPDYGKLREPVMFVTNLLRPFDPAANDNIAVSGDCNGQSDGVINDLTATMDQDVFNSPTVFNYYSMNYEIPGTPLSGPEFGIFSTGTALLRANFVNLMAPPNASGTSGIPADASPSSNFPCGTRIDLTRLQTLAAADLTGAVLLDTLNREMLHGSMSAPVRDQFLTAIQAVAPGNTLKRARTALYLVASMSQFQVQR